ncbi:MAG: HRDC domain-containing protein [Bacteroidota bacterium]|nr:HRDC domain-containing protein [Bacteroidota bacterium]
MKIKFFTIPVTAINDFEKELNSFLSNNRITEFEKKLVRAETQVYWCIFIKYEDKNIDYKNKNFKKKEKIDYVKILPPSQAKIFEQLRKIRMQIAKQDGVSAFVVATNEEIAEIAKLNNPVLLDLKKINGFGDKKAEKYGKRLLDGLKKNEK